MNFDGLVIGLGAFLIIGILHPIVIKAEYRYSKKCWPVFLILGLLSCVAALYVANNILSALLAVSGFSLFWSIRELCQQEIRVKKGWFPDNPNRDKNIKLTIVSKKTI